MRRITAVAAAGVAFVHAAACAQTTRTTASTPAAASADTLAAVRQFVQQFYDWYTPIAVVGHPFPAEYFVLSKGDRYLDKDLGSALRADSVAQAESPATATRQTLDMDPFLASQDPCGPYEVAGVMRQGTAFRVPMRPCNSKGIGPTVEVRAADGSWRITNVLYGRDGDLKGLLCKWAVADLRPERRPAKC